MVQLNFSRATSSPSEDCQVIFVASADGGTTWDSDETPFMMVWLDEDDADGSDDVFKTVIVEGVERFKMRCRLRDDDDTAATPETAQLNVDVKKDGVSA